jgi:hypothetical protein
VAQRLVKHGTDAGYKTELQTGNVCDRCRTAHRVYARQFTKKGRAAGLKYGAHDVIDNLYSRSNSEPRVSPSRSGRSADTPTPTESRQPDDLGDYTVSGSPSPDGGAQDGSGPSLRDRVSEGLSRLRVKGGNDYVDNGEAPDYIHPIDDKDPDPEGEWAEVGDEEFIINKAGMVLIEENLGTYLSVLGITMEMVDPYCGPILAENFDNIVGRWTKVIARYPRAAKLFMSKDGGTLMTWIGAIQATWPVLLAVYEHHLARTVKVNNLGQPYKVTKAQSQNGHFDATTPPMPGYEYTVD